MATVTIRINDRSYSIGCDDGQEEHLTKLADYLDGRVRELATSIGQVGDARLLVIAGLLISDELSDAYAELEQGKSAARDAEKAARRVDEAVAGERTSLAAWINENSEKIEGLAARLEDA